MFGMNKPLCSIIVLTGFIFITSTAYAAEISSFYRGIRPLGMGNAFTAIADDENSIYYNPAGLNNIEGFGSMGIINPAVEASDSFEDFVDDYNDVEDDDVAAATQLIRDYMGVHQHARASLMPHYARHNFGVAVLAQGTVDMEFRNPINPNIQAKIIKDIVPTISGAYSFFGDKLKAGATAKFIQREGLVEEYSAVEIASEDFDPEDDLVEESGVGVDIGLIYELPLLEIFNPTVGLAIQNLGDVDLGDAGEELQKVNIGFGLNFGLNYKDSELVEVLAALDYVDITNDASEDDDMAKRLHMGVELKFPILSVRAGLNQGYGTYGATINWKLLKLEYAAYIEEIGAYAGQRTDERQMIQLSIGWY